MLVGRVRGVKTDPSCGGSGCRVEGAEAGGAGGGGGGGGVVGVNILEDARHCIGLYSTNILTVRIVRKQSVE